MHFGHARRFSTTFVHPGEAQAPAQPSWSSCWFVMVVVVGSNGGASHCHDSICLSVNRQNYPYPYRCMSRDHEIYEYSSSLTWYVL
jgi:hypothetical protein